MCDKTMENYKPNMFQLQCLKALEIQIEEGKGYNEAEIGRKMQVTDQQSPDASKDTEKKDSWKIKDLPEKEKNS